jgi:hypothetical protein
MLVAFNTKLNKVTGSRNPAAAGTRGIGGEDTSDFPPVA